jgi:CheY-like chemotaxis protein
LGQRRFPGTGSAYDTYYDGLHIHSPFVNAHLHGMGPLTKLLAPLPRFPLYVIYQGKPFFKHIKMPLHAQDTNEGNRHVLIVDDDKGILSLFSRILSPAHQVLTASSVQEAESMLLSHPIQVIVCDHHMEGENGLSFLSRLRDSHPAMQRILITGDVQTDLLLEAINQGHLFRFLVKPTTAKDLIHAVDHAFEHYAATRRRERRAKVLLTLTHTPKLIGLAIIGLLLLFIAILLLGTLIFLVLYFFKSALGIDLMPNTHLPDLL